MLTSLCLQLFMDMKIQVNLENIKINLWWNFACGRATNDSQVMVIKNFVFLSNYSK